MNHVSREYIATPKNKGIEAMKKNMQTMICSYNL